jgi:hypothetical protein
MIFNGNINSVPLGNLAGWSLHPNGPQNNYIAIRPNFGLDGVSIPDKRICLMELIILGLTVHWLLSFFGQSTVPRLLHTSGFIDMLSIVIVVLIIINFLL